MADPKDKPIELKYPDHCNNMLIFVDNKTYNDLQEAFKGNVSRLSFSYSTMLNDPKSEKRLHLDLNSLIAIKEL